MTNLHGHKPHKGYAWKLCPYSSEYKALFYDLGYRGSSVNPELQAGASWAPFATTVHTTTNGYMIMSYSKNKGFMCTDPLCPYYVDNGVFYIEV